MLEAYILNLVKDWIKFLTKLIRRLSRVRLKLYETPDEDVHVENLGILIGLKS
jgi:hypothetical protein